MRSKKPASNLMSRASGFVRLKPRRAVNRVIQAVLINWSLFSKAVKRLFTIYIRAPGSLEDGAQEAELLWRYRFTSQTKIHLQKRSAFSFCALKRREGIDADAQGTSYEQFRHSTRRRDYVCA